MNSSEDCESKLPSEYEKNMFLSSCSPICIANILSWHGPRDLNPTSLDDRFNNSANILPQYCFFKYLMSFSMKLHSKPTRMIFNFLKLNHEIDASSLQNKFSFFSFHFNDRLNHGSSPQYLSVVYAFLTFLSYYIG